MIHEGLSRNDRARSEGLGLAFGALVGGMIAIGFWLAVIVVAYVVSVLA